MSLFWKASSKLAFMMCAHLENKNIFFIDYTNFLLLNIQICQIILLQSVIVCIYVCVCIYIYICMYICIYIHIYKHIYMYIYMYVYMYVSIYMVQNIYVIIILHIGYEVIAQSS